MTKQHAPDIVYVCSPYRGNVSYNEQAARNFSKFIADQNIMPIAPHLLLTQFYDDNDPTDHAHAIKLNTILLEKCEAVYVLGPRVSVGMEHELIWALENNKPIKLFIGSNDTDSTDDINSADNTDSTDSTDNTKAQRAPKHFTTWNVDIAQLLEQIKSSRQEQETTQKNRGHINKTVAKPITTLAKHKPLSTLSDGDGDND